MTAAAEDRLSALQRRLRDAGRRLQGVEDSPVTAAPRPAADAGLLSHQQEWMWMASQFAERPAAYNVPEAVRVHGTLAPDRLASALSQVLRRHDILRTRVHLRPDGPVGTVVDDDGRFTHLEAPDLEAALHLVRSAVERPFDLASEGPLRLFAIQFGHRDWVVLVVVHHIATDAWSMARFWAELGSAYDGDLTEPLPTQYARYAAWQRQETPASSAASMDYWRTRLAGLRPLAMPTDRPRGTSRSGDGATCHVRFPTDLTARLRSFSARESSTLFATLLAGFVAVLGRWCGQSDVAVGTPLADPARARFEFTIGPFINTAVIRADLADDPPLADLARRLQHDTVAAYEHQDVPFWQLAERLSPRRDRSRNPLYDVMFTLEQERPSASFRLPGARVETLLLSSTTAKVDLALFVTDDGDQLSASIDYDRGLYSAETVDGLLATYLRFLDRASETAPDPREAP